MGDLEFRLLNDFQRNFPLCFEPFHEIAGRCGVDPGVVIEAYGKFLENGTVSRIGAVFAPNRIGASTLAAIQVPEARVAEVARYINAHGEVNHNYQREHAWNVWFVATAPDTGRLDEVLADIERECGLSVMSLPLVTDFHIDLGFDLRTGTVPLRGAHAAGAPLKLDAQQAAVVAALQSGLVLGSRPYAVLADRAGITESAAIAQLKRWLGAGVIRRFGVIVRHHELGFGANAMVVLDVPDADVNGLGRRMAAEQEVTLCYRRPRRLPRWQYNLFCMIHGRSREAVLSRISALIERCGAAHYPMEALFSQRCFKQRGAHYAAEPAYG